MSAKKKPTAANANTEKKILKIIALCLAAVIVCYVVYEIYDVNRTLVTTKTTYEKTVYETLDIKAFIIRDEQYITNSANGTVVSLADYGERVAGNANIAAVFSSSAQADSYVRLTEFSNDLERYNSLTSQATFAGLKVGTLSKQTRSEICDCLNSVDNGDISSALKSISDFRDNATALEIAIDGTLDLSSKISSLTQQINAANSSLGAYERVSTGIDKAGFYMNDTDGYENTVSYQDAENLTVADITKALASEPRQSGSSLGKLMCSYKWYLATVVNTEDARDLNVGSYMTINFPHSGAESIKAKLCSKNDDTKGKTALVFSCSTVSAELLSLRCEDAQIVTGEHNGFAVDSSAVRIVKIKDKDVSGVYVLRGNVVSFRRIDQVYAGDNYILSKVTAGSGYVQLYDEIIISGRDLYDGALVSE